jgi:exonuclease SbcC
MISLNHSKRKLYNVLETVLRDVFWRKQPEIRFVKAPGFPILLLTTPNDVAAFTLFNGELEQTYESSYDQFKSYYREYHSDWSSRTLSFVLCRMNDDRQQDKFFNTIEADIYFCRKYVIYYYESLAKLRSEIRRLPFVPLPEEPGGISRPLSAQSVLQNLQIDATLARHIVVPGEYSAENIVKNWLKDKQEVPDLKPSPIAPTPLAHHLPAATRIKSLSIEGFRAYKERQDFDLDGSIIVIYGPNGLGKTSFFDAIDFLCTGRIGRLGRRRIDKDEFIKLARHLDVPRGIGNVTMVAEHDSKIACVSRRITDWSVAYIDGIESDRFSFLKFLTSADWQERPRIENLERLFRATHLFSQSDPELFQSLESQSIIPRDLVSRMLALDDYASGAKKVELVDTVIRRNINEKEKNIQILEQWIRETKSRLEEFRKLPVDLGSTPSTELLAEEVKKEIKKTTGIDVPTGPYTIKNIQDWRSMLEGMLSQCNTKLQQAILLKQNFAKIQTCRNTVSVYPTRVKELEDFIITNRKVFTELTQLLNNTRVDANNLKVKLSDYQQLYSKYINAQNILGRISQAFEDQKVWATKLHDIMTEANKADRSLNDLQTDLTNIESNLKDLEAKFLKVDAICRGFVDLSSALSQWSQDLISRTKITPIIAGLQQKVKEGDKAQSEIEENILEIEQKLAQAESKYVTATKNQSELTSLLDSLEKFLTQGICPLCGADYYSVDQLVSRVRAQKEVRPIAVTQLAEQYGSFKKQLDVLRNSLETMIKSKAEIENHLKMASSELANVSSRINTFEGKAALVGLSPVSESFSSDVKQLEIKAIKNAAKVTNALQKLRVRREFLLEEAQRVQQFREALYENLNTTKAQLTRRRKELSELQKCLLESGLPQDVSDSWIANKLKETEAKIQQTKSKSDKVDIEIKRVQVEIFRTDSEHQQLLSRMQELETEWRANLQVLQEFSHGLSQAELPESSTLAEIEDEILALTSHRDSLDRIAGRLRLLEQALDAATRSAAIADLDNQLQQKNEEAQELNKDISKLLELRNWFEKIGKILNGQNERAVKEHIHAYGPLSTIIQQRLRAVYGFGDISLDHFGGEIKIEVKWKDRSWKLKPSDYFSESQRQILMISLFLASRLTQTWSGFSSILLDDPVTHFDDLNAFAFVELIRGILETHGTDKQFIISTCEERLFNLLRQKFNTFSGRGIFYKFIAMSDSGPVIQQI